MQNEILFFSLEKNISNEININNNPAAKDEQFNKYLRNLFVRETLLAEKFNCIVLKKVFYFNIKFNNN